MRQILFYTRKRRCERHRKLAENQEEIANDVYNSTFDKACEEMAAKSRIVQCPELIIGSTVYTPFTPNYKSVLIFLDSLLLLMYFCFVSVIVYISRCIAKTIYLEKPKQLAIWNRESNSYRLLHNV